MYYYAKEIREEVKERAFLCRWMDEYTHMQLWINGTDYALNTGITYSCLFRSRLHLRIILARIKKICKYIDFEILKME